MKKSAMIVKAMTVITLSSTLILGPIQVCANESIQPVQMSKHATGGTKIYIRWLYGWIYKGDTRKVIDNCIYIGSHAKNYYYYLVDAAATNTELYTIENEVTNLNYGIASARGEIQGLPNLTEGERNGYIAQLNSCLSLKEVSVILNKARQRNRDEREKVDDLAAAKEKAITLVEGLTYLTSEQKKQYESSIRTATVQSQIDNSLEMAQSLNDRLKEGADLNGLKMTAKERLLQIPNLDQAALNKYFDLVNKATSETELTDIVNQAFLESATVEQGLELQGIKEEAINAISVMNYLSPTEKNQWIQKINDSKEKSTVDQIVADAQIQDNKNSDLAHLEEFKQDAIANIESLENLLFDEKKVYEEQVNQATNYNEVTTALATAEKADGEREQHEIDLDDAKEAAKSSVDGLTTLSDAEKKDYEDRIDTAEDFQGITLATTEASVIDTERRDTQKEVAELAKAKATADSIVDKLADLTDSEKESAKNAINDATGLSDLISVFAGVEANNTTIAVKEAVDKAVKEQTNTSIVKIKMDLIANIEKISDLSDAMKATIEDAIMQADSLDSLAEVIEGIISSEAAGSNGDFNNDGVVDVADLNILVGAMEVKPGDTIGTGGAFQ